MGGKSKSNQSSSSQNVNNSQGVNSGVGMNYGVNQSGNFGINQGSSNNFGFNQGSSSGSSQSSGQSSSQSNQNVWGAQSPFLQDVYGQAQDAFNSGMASIEGMTPEVQQQMTDAFQSAAGGFGDQMGGGFAAGLQGQIGPNSYVDAMKGQIADDANRLKQQNLGGLDARAAAAGMSGSSGYRDQVGNMMNDVDRNAMNQMTNVGYQAHNQGIQNQMQLANMMDQNQQGAMANLGNIQQGAMAQFNPAMMGQQATAMYGQTIGGPTTLTDSSSQSSGGSTSSNSSNNFGMNTGQSNSIGMNNSFSNGMNVGMNQSGGFNNAFGNSAGNGTSSSSEWNVDGQALGAAAMAMGASDIRLKKNVEHVEQIDGVNMYTWDWKDPELSWPMNYGVIAQEVADTHPEAVFEGDHGYLMVDYSKLGRAGEVALARMEG